MAGLLALLLFAVCRSSTLHAQPGKGEQDQNLSFDRILSENMSIQKGLSQNTIYCMTQDSEGFMWFGTWDGLNRYDAYSFLIFSREQGLSNEAIRALFQDGDSIYVGTENGLNIIRLSTGEISSYFSIEGDSNSLSNNWINHIYKDNTGSIWLSTASGLSELRKNTNNFRQVFSRDYGNPLRSNHMNMMAQDAQNNYWIATSYGLVFYDPVRKSLTRYFHIPADESSLPDNHVNCMAFDDDQNLWIGTKKGLAFLDQKTGRFERIDLPGDTEKTATGKEVLSLLAEPGKGIWIGTNGNGLHYYPFATQKIRHFTNRPNRLYSLSDNRIYSIFKDSNNNIWVGTFNGLNRLDQEAPKFRTYRNNSEFSNSLSNNSVWCFIEDKPNIIWIGTDDGVNIFDKENNNYSFIRKVPGNENSLSGNEIRSMHKDRQGRYWIGTRNSGLNCYLPSKRKYLHFISDPKNPQSLSNNYVTAIQDDSLGNIWVATDYGLGKLDLETRQFKNYYSDSKQPFSLTDNKLYDLFIDSRNRLWVCSGSGLMRYRYETDDFEHFYLPDKNGNSQMVMTNKFFSVTESKDGIFWIGTRGGGLVKFNPDQATFQVYTEKDGLPNNVTYSAIEDKAGNVWVATNWGLSRYNPEANSFTNYDVTDGLQSNEFNLNAGMMTHDGELYFGGMNGFNAFYPEEIKINRKVPPVRITAFKKFHLVQTRDIKEGDTVILNYDDNFFTIEFSALDYTNPAKNKYRYMLENYNSDWIDRNADKRFAEYARVSPGTYRFRVIASNSDGFWNLQGASLVIIIQPAWYSTWIFRFAMLMLIVALIYLLVYLRMRNIRHKHEIEKKYLAFEKQLYELEQKALQLQMNPHFLFNSLNSIQSFVVNNDIDNAIHYLSKFSQLMRRTLSNSRESYIPLRDELQALQLYLDIESLRFHGKFEYTIKLDPEIDDGFIEIPPMILQPYVENAIVHGLMHSPKTGHLKIDISMQDDNILCIIEDDGVGREKAAAIRRESGIERKSQGMLITQERLDILNQSTKDIYTVQVIDLFDREGHACGTRVEVRIHFKD